MFWKTAERLAKAGRRLPAVRSWSIVRRLTVFYTVVATTLLLIATGLLYWVLNTSLREAHTAFLMDEITKLTGLVNRARNEPEPVSFQAALEGEARAQHVSYTTTDMMEGITAFLERRDPRFTGK